MQTPLGHLLLFLLFLNSCQSTQRSCEQLAHELNQLSLTEIDDFTPAHQLQHQLDSIDLLRQTAEDLLPPDDLRREQACFANLWQQLTEQQALLKGYQSNPSLYRMGAHLQKALSQTTQSLQNRLEHCHVLLQTAPDYYQSAKIKISQADSNLLAQAIADHLSDISFLQRSYRDSLPADFALAQQADIQACYYAMKDYLAWCNSQLIAQSR